MADYKASEVTGNTWQRACRIIFENQYNTTPSINIVEERITNLGDRVIAELCSNIYAPFLPTETFPLRDYSTGEIITEHPEISQAELFTILYSLYMYLAEKRDNEATEERKLCLWKNCHLSLLWTRPIS